MQKFLIMNKQRLLRFLPKFLEDRTDDDQFNDEKTWLIKAIGNFPDNINAVRASGSGNAAVPTQAAQTQQNMSSTPVRT